MSGSHRSRQRKFLAVFFVALPVWSSTSEARVHLQVDGVGLVQKIIIPTLQFNIGQKFAVGPTMMYFLSSTGVANGLGYGLRGDYFVSGGNVFMNGISVGPEVQYLSTSVAKFYYLSANLGYHYYVGRKLNFYGGAKALYISKISGTSKSISAGFSPSFELTVGFTF